MKNLKYGLAWHERFSIGYEHVDAQHRRLFQLVDELIVACMDGSDTDRLKGTIDFLVNYTIGHFHDEEEVQITWKYPEYEAHKQMHDDFKGVVVDIVRRYETHGSTRELSDDINKIIVRWVVNHVQFEDKKIGDFIRRADNRFRPIVD